MEKMKKELISCIAEIVKLHKRHGPQVFFNKAYLDNLKKADELVNKIAKLEKN